MRQKLLAILCLSLFALSSAFAQTRTISGKVTDQESGTTIPGVSVSVKGASVATQTDADGNFRLNVPQNATTLVVNFIGYVKQEVALTSSNTYNVVLVPDVTQLSEVVIVGYGSGRRVGASVGTVSTVNAKDIEKKPMANAFDALQGRVAGLQIFTSSGEPSQASSIRLHGSGSLGASNTPLFVMDGIPVASGAIVSLNPNDIESVNVLKDASSTSIYGSRAANGVIYITTKKGKLNQPASITVSSQYGISQIANLDFFKQFMNADQLANFWVATGYQTQAQMTALRAQYPNDFQWYKAYYRDDAPTFQTNLEISGGGGKTTYFITGSYFKQQGLAYRSDFERYTLRSNLASTINDWAQFGVNLSMGNDDRETNPYGSNSTNRGLALLAAPFFSIYDANGNEYPDMIPGWGRYNPRYLEAKLPGTGNNLQFNPSVYLQITPFKNFTLRTQGGMDAYVWRTSSKQLPSYIGSLNNGSVSEGYERDIQRTVNTTAEYRFTVGSSHNITALAGHEYIDGTNSSFSGSSTGQTDDRLVLIQAGPNNRNASSGLSEYSYNSFFGRLEYNFNNKYFVDGSIRNDASSRFGVDNRNATFWSAGIMWKMKQESFLSDVSWLTDLNLRASIGTQGNSAIGNYANLSTVANNLYNDASGFGLNSPGNPVLGWEKQTKTTVNLEGAVFNKLRFDFTFYNRDTENQFVSVPVPFTTGFSSVLRNVGSLNNKGIDIELSADILNNPAKKAWITPYVNLTYNKQKLTELFEGRSYWVIAGTGLGWVVGQPVSYLYPIFAGVDPATGNATWYQRNPGAEGQIGTRKDENAKTSTFNAGNLEQNTGLIREPNFYGGFGFDAGFKGLNLRADFSFVDNKYMINNDRYFFENPNVFPGFNQSTRVLDYWKQPGDQTLFPRYGVQFTQFDDRLIEDASFMRLKAVTLSYTLPESILKATKAVKGARIYFTGRNVLTWTKYLGPDPEVDSNLGLGTNPNTKQFTLGLDLKF